MHLGGPPGRGLKNKDDVLASTESIVFIIAITLRIAISALYELKTIRKNFRNVILYIFDSYNFPKALLKALPFSRIARIGKLLSSVDHIFVGLEGGEKEYGTCVETNISYVPLAADVKNFGSCETNGRCISVNAYGRQNESHTSILSRQFNSKDSEQLFAHTNHLHIDKILNYVEHRRQFWSLLRHSKISLAYDGYIVNRSGKNRFPFSFIGQRWFESLAAGCVVVGNRPTCASTDEYIGWEDATIECPNGDGEFLQFIEELLQDTERLVKTCQRNYANSLIKNDWRCRLVNILEVSQNEIGTKLAKDVSCLESEGKTILEKINKLD